jgi:hypothetical protein
MTDAEMLKLCLEAFEAIPIAADARKVLRKLGEPLFSINGSQQLAQHMKRMLKAHLFPNGEEIPD